MRVAVECKSLLMQKSLELFLGKYLSSIKNCDIVLRDVKCLDDKRCFYISSAKDADLIKPFSKSQLILALEKRYKRIGKTDIKDRYMDNENLDFSILEDRIASLTKEYQANILKVVRAFYEK
ncbi:MAG: hypothetical protein A2513_07015 [Sulfurimonas sp. RIFOXYD12_FULL_33_39]|uniref:hypothetical protein n=1 Tax=unclassified Sulfurimonas TaxID=2623549 RepID=UPI0008C01EE7|nr:MULTISPECIES: hypothetical protein [unclassified Sulfurimonas]OHE01634.1 MAG: hypothetical protein A3G74_06775 [Sulfurimonas sp. RIFCSPLOWO2_12_FULL_34_6]OHE10602.1 MAG: hypothetical protein A2513_07015 [Sulfurimonas sp. RIFOXYD12_FULL_33_39]OHE15061.1 MAG: hypothetical protein A2530_01205 [Sulfurimonas sp. RIFOXYD2_FULL_34_21]DAB27422.1 MAG TPA: hypothetical protein CFH78_07950 [Sulfurimonas sp. UBA10385]